MTLHCPKRLSQLFEGGVVLSAMHAGILNLFALEVGHHDVFIVVDEAYEDLGGHFSNGFDESFLDGVEFVLGDAGVDDEEQPASACPHVVALFDNGIAESLLVRVVGGTEIALPLPHVAIFACVGVDSSRAFRTNRELSLLQFLRLGDEGRVEKSSWHDGLLSHGLGAGQL